MNPQVKDGRFTVEMAFDRSPAGLQPGQSIDCRLTLGQPANALLLSDGAYYQDTGGSWVFVIDPDGKSATRRQVKLGRRAVGQVEIIGGLTAGERVVVSSYRRFLEATQLTLVK
jgi:HlyD family secretion protein